MWLLASLAGATVFAGIWLLGSLPFGLFNIVVVAYLGFFTWALLYAVFSFIVGDKNDA